MLSRRDEFVLVVWPEMYRQGVAIGTVSNEFIRVEAVKEADALIAKLDEGQPSGDSGEFIRIPTADWLRLVKLLGSLRLGGSWYPEIDKIVASVNGGE
jgi:hypothetical protein